ncbi:MAG: PAS domain-containing protein [Oligoflexia bacterium]|nr:PAS domain-containing protein [Oligoflexia bacterium]
MAIELQQNKKEKTFTKLVNTLPWKFFRKLALVQIVMASFIIIATAWTAREFLETHLTNQAQAQINESLDLIKQSIETQKLSPLKWCKSLSKDSKTRYTVINDRGTAVCDNVVSLNKIESLFPKDEVRDAIRLGEGTAVRDEGKGPEVFGAISIDIQLDGMQQRFIIRQSIPLGKISEAMKEWDKTIISLLFPLLIITSLISLWGSLQVSTPLRGILTKIEKMKRVTQDTTLTEEEDEWLIVEKTLENAQKGLESFLDELHKENEKMFTVMESIKDSLLAVGKNNEVLFVNNHFRKTFLNKTIKKKELSQLKLWEVIRDQQIQDLYKEALESLELKKIRNVELPVKGGKRNGYFDIRISPLMNSKNETFGAVAVFHDVTDRKLADQMREDFVANVSHEVRTPLTAMKGYVQILKNANSENFDSMKSFLDKIEQNSDRLTTLFNDILNLSVIESSGGKIKKETLIPEEITSNVIANVRQGFHDKNISIDCDYAIEKCWANPQMLEQVLTNLIDNAFKYTPENGQIHVKWTQTEDKKYDLLTISDNGFGISKEHHGRLFERFYRVDSSRSREIGGTGLGLAIVKHIMQNHNGKIEVKSKEGDGTTFLCHFPAHY